MIFRRATVNSHASGLSGQPFFGQSVSADANASASASSAAADIAGSRREKRNQLAVTATRNRIGRAMRVDVHGCG